MATKFKVHRQAGTADQPDPAITDVPTGIDASASDNATAINSILAALRAHGIIEE